MAASARGEFIERVRDRARSVGASIVFPESADARVLQAVDAIAAAAIAHPVLVLDPERPDSHAAARGVGVEVLDPVTDHRRSEIAGHIEARRKRDISPQEAERLASDPLYFAAALVAGGHADGCVAGATHTTADVLRAALRVIGPAHDIRTVSSAFYILPPPFRAGRNGMQGHEVLTFADCAVVPAPTASQIADIAVAAAADRRRIVGDEPRVALLSWSTMGSGRGESVRRVQKALAMLRARSVDFAVDGELQADAALIADVAARKAHGGVLSGDANVLVFPSLDAGNIAYKLVQRLAGAPAVGPIMQGLARPCSDLSRGAVQDDIITVAAITVLQTVGAESPRSLEYRRERMS
ncbi:MAG: phosphate acyltransferase [Gemmatimonadaceae bacterium]